MKKIFNYLKPPPGWLWYVNGLIAILVGVIAYTLHVSNATSYLSDDPKTCVNCHIMAPEYSTWFHSSHREVTNCNSCHVPHDNAFNKYLFKAKDGLRHATIFTLRAEPQVIKMHEAGQKVVLANCQRCHEKPNSEVGLLDVTWESTQHGEGKLCWDCHREVPHGRVKGLSSAPNARVPLPTSPLPDWLKKYKKEKE